MAKKDRFYFDSFVTAADYACKEAEYLIECLSDYHPENIKTMLETMHGFEHDGDSKRHEVTAALARAFVTPVDREDLVLLSQNIDNVLDSIDEVMQRFYMYRIQSVTPEAVGFARRIAECCGLMKDMLTEFSHFRKSESLHGMIIEINRMEEVCDAMYLESMHKLCGCCRDAVDMISWRDIYDKMENCADACEHVGDCVEMVVMKNS